MLIAPTVIIRASATLRANGLSGQDAPLPGTGNGPQPGGAGINGGGAGGGGGGGEGGMGGNGGPIVIFAQNIVVETGATIQQTQGGPGNGSPGAAGGVADGSGGINGANGGNGPAGSPNLGGFFEQVKL